MRRIAIFVGLFIVAVCLLPADFAFGQGATAAFNQRDDKYRLLGLKRAKEMYEVARADFDRQKELYDKQLITQQQLEQARRNFSDAEVNYQQSLLAVLFEEQYVSVASAIKYYAKDGARHV